MINKYFGQLVNNNEEFNEYLNVTLNQEKIIVTRRATFLAGILFFLFGIVDILSATSDLHLFLIIRVFISANFFLVTYLSVKHKTFFLSQYHLLISIVILFSCFGILGMIHLSEVGGIVFSTYFAGLMLILTAMFSWTYMNTSVTLFLGFLIILGYIVVYLSKAGSSHYADTALLNNLLFLLASIAFGLITDIFRKHYLFKSFISQRRLIEFLLPKPNKEITQFKNDVFLTEREFQQIINNCIFDAKASNLNLILSVIRFDSNEKENAEKNNLINDVLNVLNRQSNHEIKTYKEGNIIWSLSFTNELTEFFKSTLDSNVKKYLKGYKNKFEVNTTVIEIVIDNDFEDQKNQTIKELNNVELSSSKLSIVK